MGQMLDSIFLEQKCYESKWYIYRFEHDDPGGIGTWGKNDRSRSSLLYLLGETGERHPPEKRNLDKTLPLVSKTQP